MTMWFTTIEGGKGWTVIAVVNCFLMSVYILVVRFLTVLSSRISKPETSNARMGVKRVKIKDMEHPENETPMGDVGLVWKIMSNRASRG